MNEIIIGIDHGYKNMKTANTMFATRLSELAGKPDETQMDGVIEYEGKFYTIHGAPIHAVENVDKSNSKEFYILTLAALGEELQKRGIAPGPNKIHVRLGCGLPQKRYDKQKTEFRDFLWKDKEICFSYSGKKYNVIIDNITIFMQGFAALPMLTCVENKASHVVLVDIGGGTVDVIVCEKFHPMLEKCRIDSHATIALLKDIDSELQSELGSIPESDIIDYIVSGSKDVAPSDAYEEVMQKCLVDYCKYIFTRLKEWDINTDRTQICFLGGGSKVIKNFGEYGPNVHFCDDININAKGFEFFEKSIATKQR